MVPCHLPSHEGRHSSPRVDVISNPPWAVSINARAREHASATMCGSARARPELVRTLNVRVIPDLLTYPAFDLSG